MEFSITYRVGTERNDNFYFLSFSDFSYLKAWNEAIMVSFNFLNFFAIFLKFSIMRRVRTKRNKNFYFLCFSSFSNLLWLEMKPQWYFLFFLYFFAPFLEFSITHRVGTKRNDNFYFSLSLPFPTNFGLERRHNGIF